MTDIELRRTMDLEEYKERLKSTDNEYLKLLRDSCLDTVRICNEILNERYWNS